MTKFTAGTEYLWDEILRVLTAFGYKDQKRGALEGGPAQPVFVFPTEDHELFTNAHDRPRRTVTMQVNPQYPDLNDRLRASKTGLEVGLFFRPRRQRLFKFLGPAGFVSANGNFYTFRY